MVIDAPVVGANINDPVVRMMAIEYRGIEMSAQAYRKHRDFANKVLPGSTVTQWADVGQRMHEADVKKSEERTKRVNDFIAGLPEKEREWLRGVQKAAQKDPYGGYDKFELMLDSLTKEEKDPARFSPDIKEQDDENAYRKLQRGLEDDAELKRFFDMRSQTKMRALAGRLSQGDPNWAHEFVKRAPKEDQDWIKEGSAFGLSSDKRLEHALARLPEKDRVWLAPAMARMDEKDHRQFHALASGGSDGVKQLAAKFETTRWGEILPKLDELEGLANRHVEILQAARESPKLLVRVNEGRKARGAEPLKSGKLLVDQVNYHLHLAKDGFEPYAKSLTAQTGPLTLKFRDPSFAVEKLKWNGKTPSNGGGDQTEAQNELHDTGAQLWTKPGAPGKDGVKINDGYRLPAMKDALDDVIKREKLRLEFAEEVKKTEEYLRLPTDKEKAEYLGVRMIDSYTFNYDREVDGYWGPTFGKQIKKDQLAIDKHSGHPQISMYEFGNAQNIQKLINEQRAKNKAREPEPLKSPQKVPDAKESGLGGLIPALPGAALPVAPAPRQR